MMCSVASSSGWDRQQYKHVNDEEMKRKSATAESENITTARGMGSLGEPSKDLSENLLLLLPFNLCQITARVWKVTWAKAMCQYTDKNLSVIVIYSTVPFSTEDELCRFRKFEHLNQCFEEPGFEKLWGTRWCVFEHTDLCSEDSRSAYLQQIQGNGTIPPQTSLFSPSTLTVMPLSTSRRS